MGNTGIDDDKIHVNRMSFRWPWQCSGTRICTSPDLAHPVLHWKPMDDTILGECLRCIAPAAAMVIEIGGKHKNTNRIQLLASNNGTNQSLVVLENSIPQNGPSTQLINAKSFVKM